MIVFTAKAWCLVAKRPASEAFDVEVLGKLMDASTDTRSILEAAKAIGQLADPRLGALRKRLLTHELWSVRAEFLAQSCASKHHALSEDEVFQAMSDEHPLVRVQAMQYIGGNPRKYLSERVKGCLLKAFSDPNERVRAIAVARSGAFDAATVRPILLDLVRNDRALRVRSATVEMLALDLAEDDARPEILKCFEECLAKATNHRLVSTLAAYLWKHKHQIAVTRLKELAASPVPVARKAAAWALGEVPADNDAIELLMTLFERETDYDVHTSLTNAISKQTESRHTVASLLAKTKEGQALVGNAPTKTVKVAS